MTCRARYLLALTSLALAACAAPTAPTTSWNLPVESNLPQPQLLTRAEMKANPPHPFARYDNPDDEPTRFIFRPRNVETDQNADNGTDNGAANDAGGDTGGE